MIKKFRCPYPIFVAIQKINDDSFVFVGSKPLLLPSSFLLYYDQLTIFWCFCSWEMSTLGILLGDLTPNNTPLRLGTPQCWELHRKLILLHIGHIHLAPLMEDSIVLFIAQLHWVANHRSGSPLDYYVILGHVLYMPMSFFANSLGYGKVGSLMWENLQTFCSEFQE